MGAYNTTTRQWEVPSGGRVEVTSTDLQNAKIDTLEEAADAGSTRTGCRLRRPSQTIASNNLSAISWNTEDEDTDGFFPAGLGPTVTIPAGLDGIYAVTLRAAAPISGRAFIEIVPTSVITGMPQSFRSVMDPAEDRTAVSAVLPLEAGDSLACQIFHLTGSNQDVDAWLSMYRISL